MGKKIKCQQFTKYPMLDLVIKKVKSLGRRLVEEDLVPYPLLAMEFPGVTLDRDTPAIEDKIVPQVSVEDTAAQNANNLARLNIIAGEDGPAIVDAPNDKIKYDNDINDIKTHFTLQTETVFLVE